MDFNSSGHYGDKLEEEEEVGGIFLRHVLVLVLVRGRAAADAARESHWYSGDVMSSWSELLFLLWQALRLLDLCKGIIDHDYILYTMT